MKKLFSLFLMIALSISSQARAWAQGEDCVDFAQEGVQLEMDNFGPMTFSEYNTAFLEWYSLCRDAQQ